MSGVLGVETKGSRLEKFEKSIRHSSGDENSYLELRKESRAGVGDANSRNY